VIRAKQEDGSFPPAGERRSATGRCAGCAHFEADPALVETALPGLKSLASAYSSVSAGAGLCVLHDLIVSPWKGCGDFEKRAAGA
jgi:hypothetical protein